MLIKFAASWQQMDSEALDGFFALLLPESIGNLQNSKCYNSVDFVRLSRENSENNLK